MEGEQDSKRSELDREREQLLEQAVAIPSVAKALEVFQAASARAPYVPPPEPVIHFSTSTNG